MWWERPPSDIDVKSHRCKMWDSETKSASGHMRSSAYQLTVLHEDHRLRSSLVCTFRAVDLLAYLGERRLDSSWLGSGIVAGATPTYRLAAAI